MRCAVAKPRALKALLAVLHLGGPRAKVVCMRVLRKLLCSDASVAPTPAVIDRELQSLPSSSTGGVGEFVVWDEGKSKGRAAVAGEQLAQFLLRQIGQIMSVSAFTSLVRAQWQCGVITEAPGLIVVRVVPAVPGHSVCDACTA